MSRSLAIFLAVAIGVLCFTGGLLVLIGGSPRVKEVESRQRVDAPIDDSAQMIFDLQAENDNLRGQIEVLEQMVEKLNAEIEEINAVMDRPSSS